MRGIRDRGLNITQKVGFIICEFLLCPSFLVIVRVGPNSVNHFRKSIGNFCEEEEEEGAEKVYGKSSSSLPPPQIFSYTSFTPTLRQTRSKRIPSRKLSIIELEKYCGTGYRQLHRPTILDQKLHKF